ncbi:hypothetical protein [uncultured Corynebacterium sp.]|uniref:hypothetical protein n=1 Tax=uncultured Corynebacterium sp. TaxID=159447 RepID=UPI002616616A|nr:hypothetical protein [uncultured Corynebacterium sp.]
MTNNRSTWRLTVTKALCEITHNKMTRRQTLNLRSTVSGKGTTLALLNVRQLPYVCRHRKWRPSRLSASIAE